MKRCKFRLAFLITLVISLLVACNAGREVTSGNDKKILIMATSADFPPYEFVKDSGDPQIVGFDVDVAKRIIEKLGYGLRIDNIEFKNLIPALQSGRADFVMAGMVPTEARRQNVDFTQTYYIEKNAIVSRRGTGLATPESLSQKTVGVQRGSIQAQRAKEIWNVKIMSFQQVDEIIQALRTAKVEAALMAEPAMAGYLTANPDLEIHPIPSIPGKSGVAIAFPKGSPLVQEFDQIIHTMRATGEMDQLALKWFSDSEAILESRSTKLTELN